MPSASSAGFLGTTRKPSSPSFTKSGIAPTAVAMTGSPAAMASGITSGNASVQDGTTIIGANHGLHRIALGDAYQYETCFGMALCHQGDSVEQIVNALGC